MWCLHCSYLPVNVIDACIAEIVSYIVYRDHSINLNCDNLVIKPATPAIDLLLRDKYQCINKISKHSYWYGIAT